MSVYFYGCVTLDGYLADKNHGLGWLHETGGVEETGYDAFYRQMDVTLMGRKTFQEIKTLGDPSSIYPTTQNYVFTHRTAPLPQGFTPVSGDVPALVEGLGRDKNIWIIGGNTILSPLLNRDMVDHIILQLAPVLLGGGIPLFTQEEHLHRFHLDEVRQYGPFAELRYSRA
ncbi:MAG: dihydrofolate reductase [Oscillospiraceae bacterium]|jgi:dihydrofolate reductase|nr:dihydrofolate reductase [Oscillospiraceae bacterium]